MIEIKNSLDEFGGDKNQTTCDETNTQAHVKREFFASVEEFFDCVDILRELRRRGATCITVHGSIVKGKGPNHRDIDLHTQFPIPQQIPLPQINPHDESIPVIVYQLINSQEFWQDILRGYQKVHAPIGHPELGGRNGSRSGVKFDLYPEYGAFTDSFFDDQDKQMARVLYKRKLV